MADAWLHEFWERRVKEQDQHRGAIEFDFNDWHYWVIYSYDGYVRPYSIEYVWAIRKGNERKSNPEDSEGAFGMPGTWLEHTCSLLIDCFGEKIAKKRDNNG